MRKRLLYPAVLGMILANIFYVFCAFSQENTGIKKTWLTEIVNDLEINKQNLMIQLKKTEANIAVVENIIAQAGNENNREAKVLGKQALSAAKQAKKKARAAILEAGKKIAHIRQRLSKLADSDFKISAVITGYSGEVVYYSKKLGKEVSLNEARFCLEDGDLIRTKSGAFVQMYCFDGRGKVDIGENTVIVMKNEGGDSFLDLVTGQIRLKVKKSKRKVEEYLSKCPHRVRTPTAILGIRGTEFSVFVDKSQAADIIVFEGSVEVSAINDTKNAAKTVIEAGYKVHVTAQGDIQEIQKIK